MSLLVEGYWILVKKRHVLLFHYGLVFLLLNALMSVSVTSFFLFAKRKFD